LIYTFHKIRGDEKIWLQEEQLRDELQQGELQEGLLLGKREQQLQKEGEDK